MKCSFCGRTGGTGAECRDGLACQGCGASSWTHFRGSIETASSGPALGMGDYMLSTWAVPANALFPVNRSSAGGNAR